MLSHPTWSFLVPHAAHGQFLIILSTNVCLSRRECGVADRAARQEQRLIEETSQKVEEWCGLKLGFIWQCKHCLASWRPFLSARSDLACAKLFCEAACQVFSRPRRCMKRGVKLIDVMMCFKSNPKQIRNKNVRIPNPARILSRFTPPGSE